MTFAKGLCLVAQSFFMDASKFKGELARMVTEGWTARVAIGIQKAIEQSFREDLIRRPVTTQEETRRRFNICAEGFCIMRKDLHWAVPRILDELPKYLRCQLDGDQWSPDEDRGAWLSEDKSEMPLEIDTDAEDQSEDISDVDGGLEIGHCS